MVTKKKYVKVSLFDVVNLVVLTLVAATMLYPLINVLAISLSEYSEALKSPWMVIPKDISFEGYEYVFENQNFWRSYLNSIFLTLASTLMGLFVNATMAWPLARRETKGKGILMGIVIFTMVFNAGMIPNYLNMKELKLLDTYWALILPGSFSAYNCVIMINFFRQLPYELIEAAKIDGASEPHIFARIVLPLSKPVLASIALFLAVGMWNSYFGAQIYLRDRELWPMALMLKEILLQASTAVLDAGVDPEALGRAVEPKTIQYACIIVSTVPIMCIYPFLQKYFAKGVMVGGVKG